MTRVEGESGTPPRPIPAENAAAMTTPPPGEARFRDLAEALLQRPGVTRSTMMGLPCLRLNDDQLARHGPFRVVDVAVAGRRFVALAVAPKVGANTVRPAAASPGATRRHMTCVWG